MIPRRTLLVFLKFPVAGAVKTRLAKSIGEDRAAYCYLQWIGLVLDNLQPLRGSVRIVGCFDGAPESAFAPWNASVDKWWQQPAGNLGERLQSGFDAWQATGSPIAAIGTDCLDVDAPLVRMAFERLRANDVVFGPAVDGGYYLVGTARHIPQFFEDVPWSTAETLASHTVQCRKHGWSVSLLPVRRDIDTWEDWLEYSRTKHAHGTTTGSAKCEIG